MSNGRRLGVRRLNAALDSKTPDRDQSGVKPPHSKAVLLLVVLLVLTSCKSQNESATTDAPAETIVSSTPPFQAKEPERYQATRTMTAVNADGKTFVTTSFTARDGDRRRHEFESFSKTVVSLDLPEGRFILFPDEKIYAELADGFNSTPTDEVVGITSEWLLHEDAGTTSYQNLGKEVIGGRNTTKYKTVVNISSSGNVSQSETLIWIDEALNMPIKSETTSTGSLRFTMELSNVTLNVDEGMFQVPNDYEKIAITELRRRLMATE